MKMESLEELFLDQLKELYNAETQLIKALPRMANAANNAQLREGFERHLTQTQKQAERLEQIFEELDVRGKGKKSDAMEGMIEQAQDLIKTDANPEVLDAGLIAAAQKVEHYEIAGYGTARTYANVLGLGKAARLLEQTLEEEKNTDSKLSELAESSINVQAADVTHEKKTQERWSPGEA